MYTSLLDVGFDAKQAVVLASAIPDIERPIADLRTELTGDIKGLRAEMHQGFVELRADMERRFSAQTKWMAGIAIAMLLAIIGSSFIP